ncbi:hypothetical protein AeMF1_013613 [Aphanomyces euteiches]|nr:hypothetical protein AeMF1_013613 [Aphanomyces euteiches]KAH9188979.1 hypothetical protein AeNC1_009051 [Aphanomyces euteiches]
MAGPSTELFIPYVYVPSADSSYVEVVSPWGSVKVPLSVSQFYSVLVALAVVLATIVFTCSRSSRKKDEKKAAKKGKAVKKAEKKAAPKKPKAVPASEAKSALEENIQRNGTMSYYYAHKVREVSDAAPTRVRQIISTYGWSDGAKSVTIYVDHPEAATLDDSMIKLEWTPTSLSLDITFDEEDVRSLVVPTLYSEIESASYKLKKDTIAFVLKKKELVAWASLNGAAKNLEEHIEYDESLYD